MHWYVGPATNMAIRHGSAQKREVQFMFHVTFYIKLL